MFCWVPILITSLFDIEISSFLYEIVAIVILPLNSVVNPILYTKLLKKCFTFFKSRILSLINVISRHNVREEPRQGADIELAEL